MKSFNSLEITELRKNIRLDPSIIQTDNSTPIKKKSNQINEVKECFCVLHISLMRAPLGSAPHVIFLQQNSGEFQIFFFLYFHILFLFPSLLAILAISSFIMASAVKQATRSVVAPADLESFREHLKKCRRVVALVGAGLSAASGLPTFRGAGGLWRTHEATDLATPEAFESNPDLVWQFYSFRRHMALKAAPNKAHFALAELARKNKDFITLSQNVDGKIIPIYRLIVHTLGFSSYFLFLFCFLPSLI